MTKTTTTSLRSFHVFLPFSLLSSSLCLLSLSHLTQTLNPSTPAQKLMRSIKESKVIIPFPNNVEEVNVSSTKTVMIRNIPNHFRFRDLLFILDEHCFQENKNANNPTDHSKYDFVYLPMDYRQHAFNGRMSNLGYAFVNFTTPIAAFKFYNQFHGFAWNVAENRKICEITRAQIQVN